MDMAYNTDDIKGFFNELSSDLKQVRGRMHLCITGESGIQLTEDFVADIAPLEVTFADDGDLDQSIVTECWARLGFPPEQITLDPVTSHDVLMERTMTFHRHESLRVSAREKPLSEEAYTVPPPKL